MKRLAPLTVLLTLLTTLIIITGIVTLVQFDNKIREGLKNRNFLPPTVYYSAAETITLKSKWTAAQFLNEFSHRNYRARKIDERLHQGEYAQGSGAECQALTSEAPSDSSGCIVFRVHETWDPEQQGQPLQMVVFGPAGEIVSLFRGNPLESAQRILFEPEVIGQYLGREPIQQNYTPLGQIPTMCLNAVLAIEDQNFLEHGGVSYVGMFRALIRNIFRGRAVQGGSTITQQMVKNYFLSSEKTLKRKLTEFVMSVILESHATKDEILETYLNIIYLGQNGSYQIRGFPAASEYYFRKPIQNLNLGECSLLAAVLNSPGLYDPFKHKERATQRRNLVLDRMHKLEMISEADKIEAQRLSLPAAPKTNLFETAPYYIDAVNKELAEQGLSFEGRKIFTGLRMQAQQLAQNSLRNQLNLLEQENKTIKEIKATGKSLEGAVASVDNETGLVNSIVGGRSFKLTQFNRAVDAHRQVGSVIKPFVFLAALEKGETRDAEWTPVSILKDEPFTHTYQRQSWSPENYGKKYFGDVKMYFALKNSLNAATAQLGISIGFDAVITAAHKSGITSKMDPLPSVTLGAFELYPIEVLQSYSTLARLGSRQKLSTIRSVVDENGVLLHLREPEQEQSLSANATAQVVAMMKQTVLSGTAQAIPLLGFKMPAAGKTGTTSDNKDAWFAGFTPYVTTVVWIGYDDNTPHGLTGGSGSVPVWTEFMKGYATQFPDEDFQWPKNLVKAKITEETTPPREVELLFMPGSEPH